MLDLTCPQALLGFNNPTINSKIVSQLERGGLGPAHLFPDQTQLFHNVLARWTPAPLKESFLVSSAREATALALEMAKAYTNAAGLLTVLGGPCCPYSAEPDASSRTGSHVRCVVLPDMQTGAQRVTNRRAQRMNPSHSATQFRADAEELAASPFGVSALIVESMLTGECLNYPAGFLESAFQTVRAVGGLCIVDESQTGMGRSGSHFWYFQKVGVMPDIIIVGEALGNGFPLAAVITSKEIAAASSRVLQEFSNPFAGNTLATTVGLEVLFTLHGGAMRRVVTLGQQLLQRLKGLCENHDCISTVRAAGLFCALEICEAMDPERPAPAVAEQIQSQLRAKKILVTVEGREKNIVTLKPPLVITEREIDMIGDALAEILPSFTTTRASSKYQLLPSNLHFFREHLAFWGIEIDSINEISLLDSYEDTNFRVVITIDPSEQHCEDGLLAFIFKIDNLHTTYSHIHLQHHAMERVSAAGIPCSVHVPLLSDPSRFCMRLPSGHYCRLLKYLPGSTFSEIPSPRDEHFTKLGALAGRVATALSAIRTHPASRRPSRWNLAGCVDVIRWNLSSVKDLADNELLSRVLLSHGAQVFPDHLRFQIVHGDINDRNVIVLPADSQLGIIDFGDVSYSFRVAELAITCAYALLARVDLHPAAVIIPIVKSFHRHCPLEVNEIACLWPLVVLRLATSVTISAHTRATQTLSQQDRDYVSCSEKPAWTILRQYGSSQQSDEVSQRLLECFERLHSFPSASSRPSKDH